MKLHLDINMLDNGAWLLRPHDDEELGGWKSTFEACVMEMFRKDSVDVDLFQSLHHPRRPNSRATRLMSSWGTFGARWDVENW